MWNIVYRYLCWILNHSGLPCSHLSFIIGDPCITRYFRLLDFSNKGRLPKFVQFQINNRSRDRSFARGSGRDFTPWKSNISNLVKAEKVVKRWSSTCPAGSIEFTFSHPYNVSEIRLGKEIIEEEKGHGNSSDSYGNAITVVVSSHPVFITGSNHSSTSGKSHRMSCQRWIYCCNCFCSLTVTI